MSDKYIGKLLDNRYEILEVIGTGGMAVVYKALCHRLDRFVAVKILKDEYAKDEEFRNRFRAESHAVAMLSHPNIVAVYDVSRSNSIEYIVMELIDGITLKQYMQRRGKLSQKEIIHFSTQILKALSHAHSKGIIHRDIKPQNIMILRDSTVKVADFGIARLESSPKTVTREAFGSVHYISPEQAKGSHIDCRADIYSVGVVLYEMLTGRLPYEGDTPVSIAIQHINSLPLSPREIDSEIPSALEKITMKAMAPNLSKRYASTEEMIEDLEEYRRNPQLEISYEPPKSREEADMSETKPIGVIKAKDIDEDFEDDERNILKDKLPMISALVAAGIFVFGVLALLGAIFGWGSGGGNDEIVETPNVIGMTLEDAAERYNEFEIIETDETMREYSDEYEEGEIVKQRPREDEVNSSGKIYVTLSRGPKDDKVTLSELVNMSEEQAKIVLDRDELNYNIVRENSDEIAEGTVIKTDPESGSSLRKGDRITLYVSLGKLVKEVEVPKITGLSEEKAVSALEAAGLKKGSIGHENSDSVAKGVVIRQDVASGEKREEGTSIGFTVSLGAKKQPEPEPAPEPEKPADVPVSGDGNVTITRSFRLPTDIDSFNVKVTVNDVVQYNATHKATDEYANVKLTGKGTSVVRVYIDDESAPRQEIQIEFK